MSTKNSKRIRSVISIVTITSLILIAPIGNSYCQAALEPIADLVLRTTGGGVLPDYGLYIAQYLREIDIDVEVKVEEWLTFYDTLLLSDFDLAITSLVYPHYYPELEIYFSEDGGFNLCNLNSNIPFINESETLLRESNYISDPLYLQEVIYEFQQLMMDKIVPIYPLFAPKNYNAHWGNLKNIKYPWDLSDNLPYIYFDGLHENQNSADEFNIANFQWGNLNPLKENDEAEELVISLISNPIITLNESALPTKFGIISNWEKVNNSCYSLYIREDIFWNPSFNITMRDQYSYPLDPSNTSALLIGLGGEYSNGTNQRVTREDVVFTLLALSNPEISEDANDYAWLKRIIFDPLDDQKLTVVFDGNLETTGLETYNGFFTNLNVPILPEFFLNSSDETLYFSSGGIPHIGLHEGIQDSPQWEIFDVSSFGCGKYLMDYYIKGSITQLKSSPFWFNIGSFDGTFQELNITTIKLHCIQDSFAKIAEFKAGRLDWVDLTYHPFERKQMQNDPRFGVISYLIPSQTAMIFNLERDFIGGEDNNIFLEVSGKREYTKATAVRKAINYAINREEINQVINDGEFPVSNSVLAPYFTNFYYDNIIKYDRDLNAAEEWLEAAGYWIDETPRPNYTGEIIIIITSVILVVAASPFAILGIVNYIRKRKLKNK
ncbi:MAG: ABC transporter substrate-binding protein [Candidatus Heimdallarchaeaceae archaeon]